MTISEAAELVNRTERTIRNWKAQGVDITNREELVKHAQLQRSKAVGASRRPNAPSSVAELGELPEAGNPGAVQALKRLEADEATFHARLERALQSDDNAEIQIAHERHTKASEVLLRYEREISEAKRDLGHLIPKEEAAIAVRMAATWFRLTWMAWLSSCLPDVLALADNLRDAKAKAIETLPEILNIQMKNAANARATLPEWAIKLIDEEWRISLE